MGKKGGSETTTVELPPEIEEAALANLDIANEVGAIGYQPNRTASIAGFTPGQLNAMQGIEQQAGAFGMPTSLGRYGGNVMGPNDLYRALTGMNRPATSTPQGFNGYSGAGNYDQAIASLPPAYREAIKSFTMNPSTGAAPTNLSVPQTNTSFAYNPETGRMEATPTAQVSPQAPTAPQKSTIVPYNNDWDQDLATGRLVPRHGGGSR